MTSNSSVPLAALLAIVASASGFGCRLFEGSDDAVHAQVAAEIARAARGNDVADLSRVTAFEWETLHIFEPYTDERRARKQLGFAWSTVERTASAVQDRYALLVFVKGGRVVRWVDFERAYGDPLELPQRAIRRSEARFRVTRSSDGRLILRPPT